MKRILLTSLLAAALLVPAVWAQEGEEGGSSPATGAYEAKQEAKEVVKPHASFGFFGGAHIMASEEWEEVYGNTPVFYFGFSLGLKLIADLEMWGEVGYSVDEGKGVTQTGAGTAERYRIHVVPGSAGLLYRFKFFEEQLVVPFVGGAVNYYYFYEGRLESSEKVDGGKWGYSGEAGLQLLLDQADRRASNAMKSEYGIDNTYLFYEFRYTVVDDWGEEEGLDLSSQMHMLGLLFEF